MQYGGQLFIDTSARNKGQNGIQRNLENSLYRKRVQELINKRASDRLAGIKIDSVFIRCRGYLSALEHSRRSKRSRHREGGDGETERTHLSENSRDLALMRARCGRRSPGCRATKLRWHGTGDNCPPFDFINFRRLRRWETRSCKSAILHYI